MALTWTKNAFPAALVSAGEVRAVSGPGSGLAAIAGGEVTGVSTLAVVSGCCPLDDEVVEPVLGFAGDGGAEDAGGAALLAPIGTVSRGELTVGGMAPEVVTRSVAGDMRADRSL